MMQLIAFVVAFSSFGVSLGFATALLRENHDIISQQAELEERQRLLEEKAAEVKELAKANEKKSEDCEVFMSNYALGAGRTRKTH